MFKAKAIALKEYLQELDSRIEGGVVSAGSQSKVLDEIPTIGIEDFNVEVGEDGVYDVRSVQGG